MRKAKRMAEQMELKIKGTKLIQLYAASLPKTNDQGKLARYVVASLFLIVIFSLFNPLYG